MKDRHWAWLGLVCLLAMIVRAANVRGETYDVPMCVLAVLLGVVLYFKGRGQ